MFHGMRSFYCNGGIIYILDCKLLLGSLVYCLTFLVVRYAWCYLVCSYSMFRVCSCYIVVVFSVSPYVFFAYVSRETFYLLTSDDVIVIILLPLWCGLEDCSMSILDRVEARIVEALVDSALGADCTISVNDGGAFVLALSKDAKAILRCLGTTDSDVLVLRRAGKRIGAVTLIYGNGRDVVADFSYPSGVPYEGSWLEAIIVSAERVASSQADAEAVRFMRRVFDV